MNDRTRPFESTVFRASISFVLATVAAKMTFIPFIALVYFEKVIPKWVQVSVLVVGVSLAVFVGFKSFRWLYRYFGSL
jgi:uncharacterized membrane protein